MKQTTRNVVECISIIKQLDSATERGTTKEKVVTRRFAARFVAVLLVFLTSPVWFGVAGRLRAQHPRRVSAAPNSQSELYPSCPTQRIDGCATSRFLSLQDSSGGHIEELIPKKYRGKYEKWKKEFLATEGGRRQWDAFDHNSRLTLVIAVCHDSANGARTGKFKWDQAGNLSNATITLGCDIDSGYPNPIYYPVLNSLKALAPLKVSGSILAAAKIAHEFEHVNQAIAGGIAFRSQIEMAYAYNTLLFLNGYNTCDPRLVELAARMGGTPVEIGEVYDHRAETQAMRYLLERLKDDELRRSFLVSVKKTMNLFAQSFQQPYTELIQSLGLSRKLLSVALEAER